MFAFRVLPKVVASRMLGVAERIPLPRSLRAYAYGAYARHYGVRLEELAAPLDSFRSFNAFFTRALRPGVRPIDANPASAVSPVDGRVVAAGPIEGGRLWQAKGLDYSLEDLVGAPLVSGALVGGRSCTVYLAPGDYHRIHAPVDGEVAFTIHVPGTLWPVNDRAAKRVHNLFIRNERLVSGIETQAGTVVLVKIGAFNVGTIRTEFDPGAGRGRRRRFRAYTPPIPVVKGAPFARFEMGSTVVVLFPRAWELDPGIVPGRTLLMGEAIARRSAGPR